MSNRSYALTPSGFVDEEEDILYPSREWQTAAEAEELSFTTTSLARILSWHVHSGSISAAHLITNQWDWMERLEPTVRLERPTSLPDVMHPGLLFVSAPSVDDVFEDLASQWRAETRLKSSVEDLAMHWAYQRIIGLGPRVLPLILRELEKMPDHWFWALTAIVGEDVAAGEDTVEGAARAWVDWGRTQRLI